MSRPRRPGPEVREALPPRLIDGLGEGADLIRQALRRPPPSSEQAGWNALEARLARRPLHHAGKPLVVSGAALAAVALGLALLAPRWTAAPRALDPPTGAATPGPVAVTRASDKTGATTATPRPPAGASVQPEPRRRTIALGPTARSLPPGEVEVPVGGVAQARVTLSRAGAALAAADGAEGTRVNLLAGAVSVQAEAAPATAPRFKVVVGVYRFVVLGTAFQVGREGGAVVLRVKEGTASVERGERRLAVVSSGGSWRGPVPAVRPAPAPTAAPSSCAVLAGGDAQAGVACFLAEARTGGLGGALSLYQAGRLRRDRLGDPQGALQLFSRHRQLYPAGPLSQEVALSIIELLPRLQRHREALEQSAAHLAAWPSSERRGELHLLRGNIYREVLRDQARAEVEYTAALAAGGPATEAAAFWRAVCLERLGRRDEAIAAYRGYLRQPIAPRAAEARARLDALAK